MLRVYVYGGRHFDDVAEHPRIELHRANFARFAVLVSFAARLNPLDVRRRVIAVYCFDRYAES